MPSYKFAVLEKDGVDFALQREGDPEIMLPELGFLKDGLTADAGFTCIVADQELELKTNRIALATKYIIHSGFIKQTGFIKRTA